jgi:hypothetical protein
MAEGFVPPSDVVIAGLDPAIQSVPAQIGRDGMDPTVKPWDDDSDGRTLEASASRRRT